MSDVDDSSCCSSEFGFYEDDDNNNEDETFTSSNKRGGGGIYLSSAMENLLRRSVGSEGNLSLLAFSSQVSNERNGMSRSGSDQFRNTPESKLVYCIQTESAIEGKKHNGKTVSDRRSPSEVLNYLLKEKGALTTTYTADSFGDDFWVTGCTSGYTVELTVAVRQDNVETVRRLHESGNHNLQCCNQFYESIVHTAARRGSTKSLRYMVQEAGVSVRVCCDNGRNPLHDACWTGNPNFECIQFLLQECPDFLLMKDKRGFTPLQYAPKDTWDEWTNFLKDHQTLLIPQRFA